MIRKLFSLLAIALFAVAVNFTFPGVVNAEQFSPSHGFPQSNQSFQSDLYSQDSVYLASQNQDYNSAQDNQSSQNSNQGTSQNYQANNDEANQGYQANNDQDSQSQQQSSGYNQDNQQKS